MIGRDGHTRYGLPLAEVVAIMQAHGRGDARLPA